MRDFLLIGLDYDLWANRTWEGKLQSIPDPAPVVSCLDHILNAQRIWAERSGVANLPRQSENLDYLLRAYHASWRKIVEDSDLDRVVAYENLRGEDHARPLGEIAWHVINHGTYHRGQIRAIVEAQGMKTWPDTDLVLFFDEMRGQRTFQTSN